MIIKVFPYIKGQAFSRGFGGKSKQEIHNAVVSFYNMRHRYPDAISRARIENSYQDFGAYTETVTDLLPQAKIELLPDAEIVEKVCKALRTIDLAIDTAIDAQGSKKDISIRVDLEE